MRMAALSQIERLQYLIVCLVLIPQKSAFASHPYIEGVQHVTEKGWSSDFSPLPDAFSPKWTMALLSESHNGVHCCGTVGDSHSHSQLSTAKCTFAGDITQYRHFHPLA